LSPGLTGLKPFFFELKKELRAEPGMALVLVLVFTGVLVAFGAALITTSINEKLISGYNSRDIKLYYIIEAGIEAGISELLANTFCEETGFCFDFDTELSGQINRGFYNVSFVKKEACPENSFKAITIKSTGTLEAINKSMLVDVKITRDGLIIKEWQKPVPEI